MLGAGGTVSPDDSAVLPHGPAVPDAIELGEAIRGERAGTGHGALRAARAVESKPVGGTADDAFLLGAGGSHAGAEAIAVFQVGDRIDAGELVDAEDEFHEAVRGGLGIEIADEEHFFPGKAFCPADGADAFDEAFRLVGGILIHGDVVVGSEHHARAVGGFYEVAELVIEERAFRGAGDECLAAVLPQGGDVVLGVFRTTALDFLGIPAGDVENGGGFGNAGAAEAAAAALGEQGDEE